MNFHGCINSCHLCCVGVSLFYGDCRGCDRMVVVFTITSAISAYPTLEKKIIFIKTNSFRIFTCLNPVLLVPGFGKRYLFLFAKQKRTRTCKNHYSYQFTREKNEKNCGYLFGDSLTVIYFLLLEF
jgi:hypothetical protein